MSVEDADPSLPPSALHAAQEVHILHDYPHDFYGKELRVVILGFIRPEYNYAGLGAFSLEDPALLTGARPDSPA